MKRSRSICLVLLGGGVMLGLAACGEDEQEKACRLAREQSRPDVEQICARSQATSRSGSSSGHHYGAWYYGRGGSYAGRSSGSGWLFGRSGSAFATGDAARSAFSGGSGARSTSTVSRGGFGSTGARASSGG
ncbi:MAG TPA: hypothetical protein VGM87_12180 [Roseomonas sp.]|jgi:hypothetical protein